MTRIGSLLGSCALFVLTTLSLNTTALAAADTPAAQAEFKTIEWTDLIPPDVLDILMNPPDYIMEIEDGSIEDQISSQMKSTMSSDADPYQQALVSTKVKPEMDGAMVRLPGFIVPLEFDDQQVVTQFFLVPYFGACLHMPPPPPNQIVLVDAPQGLQLEAIYTPFWISGEMSTTLSENEVALSAYSMTLLSFEAYEE